MDGLWWWEVGYEWWYFDEKAWVCLRSGWTKTLNCPRCRGWFPMYVHVYWVSMWISAQTKQSVVPIGFQEQLQGSSVSLRKSSRKEKLEMGGWPVCILVILWFKMMHMYANSIWSRNVNYFLYILGVFDDKLVYLHSRTITLVQIGKLENTPVWSWMAELLDWFALRWMEEVLPVAW